MAEEKGWPGVHRELARVDPELVHLDMPGLDRGCQAREAIAAIGEDRRQAFAIADRTIEEEFSLHIAFEESW